MAISEEYKKPEEWLHEFHTAMEVQPFIEQDAYGRKKSLDLRMRLISEEYKEAMDELLDARNGKGDLRKIAKELADMCVVIIGTLDLMDVSFTETFKAVMVSNMSKICPDGTIARRDDGKVLKGPHYRDADLSFIPA